jgi:hypothetical protein
MLKFSMIATAAVAILGTALSAQAAPTASGTSINSESRARTVGTSHKTRRYRVSTTRHDEITSFSSSSSGTVTGGVGVNHPPRR